MVSPGLEDAKLVAKPSKLNCEPIDWAWAICKFEVINWLRVIGVLLPDEVQEVIWVSAAGGVGPDGEQDKMAKGKRLDTVTVGVLSGQALAVARNVHDRNGWEMWRQLAVYYEPVRVSRALSQLTELLSPKLNGSGASYKERLMTWERLVADYEAQHGKTLEDIVKRATIMAQARKR